MALGPVLRHALGPLEQPVAALYRSVFIDLDAFVAQVGLWAGRPGKLLELGCGEGAVVDRLADSFPEASITGIDITPRIGRLSRTGGTRVAFRQITMKDYAAECPGAADLLVLTHERRWAEYPDLMADARGHALVYRFARAGVPLFSIYDLRARPAARPPIDTATDPALEDRHPGIEETRP